MFIFVNDLFVVSIHDCFLPVVIDQVNHLVLADAKRCVARCGGGHLGARRYAAVRVVRSCGALLHVFRIVALDVLLLLVMMMMMMVMMTMMVMVVLGMERMYDRRFVQIEHVHRLHGR